MSSESLHEAAEKLSPATIDRHRATVSLMEELEAVDWYDQRIDATTDPALKRNAARCSQGTAVERRQRGADKLRIAGGDSVDPPDRARRAGEGIVAVSHQIRVRRWLPSAPDVLVSSGGRSRRSLHR